jgi:tetratricopeptide (TPR) repeat protein
MTNFHKTTIYTVIFTFLLITYSCKQSNNNEQVSQTSDPDFATIDAEIAKDPKNGALYYKRAQQYYEKEKFQNALVDVKKAISIDSLNPDYYHLLSDAYLDIANSDEAIMSLYKVLKMYPNRVPTILKLSELKYMIEDYDGSILLLNEALKTDNQNAEAFYMLGVNFKALNKKANDQKDNKVAKDMETRAINSFQTAAEMDSKLSDAWIALGEIYEAKKDPKAIKYYESAVFSNPDYMQAYHAKAFYLQNNNRIPEAKAIYRSMVVKEPSYIESYLNLGYLYLDDDSLDLAYEQFNAMAGVAPTNHMGFYMRGIVNEKKGKLAEALKDFQSAYNLKSDDKKVDDALNRIKKK